MERMTGKETVKNMEHLVKLLHKEWERSGRTKAEVSIDITDKNKVGAKLTVEIQERQKQLETAGMDFKECMALSEQSCSPWKRLRHRRRSPSERKASARRTATVQQTFLPFS